MVLELDKSCTHGWLKSLGRYPQEKHKTDTNVTK